MWGFCHSTLVIVPVTLMGLLSSNSAANEWCAATGTAADRATNATAASRLKKDRCFIRLFYAQSGDFAAEVGYARPSATSMFDLIAHGQQGRPLREAAPGSTVTSIVVHVIVVTLVLVVPLLRITHALPPPLAVGAFVASAAAPPPPPPPPPAAGAPKPVQQTA